jgi:acid phosphatase
MRALALISLSAILSAGIPASSGAAGPDPDVWPKQMPVYDHVVIVLEENKDFAQIVGNPHAPYINGVLLKEGAQFTRMFGEEHFSEGNYFWLLSGSNQNVGFADQVPPPGSIDAPNLARQLLDAGRSFKGYAEDLPAIGYTGVPKQGLYAPKHVPYISFANLPGGATAATSVNLRFQDFPHPGQFAALPTVAMVIPNLESDMHGVWQLDDADRVKDHRSLAEEEVEKGDAWLKTHLDAYYQWAKTHNSLLIVTFDENDDTTGFSGLTDPALDPDLLGVNAGPSVREALKVARNRIPTIFAGAHVKPGAYDEAPGITHVNLLRTLEAMYGLPKAGGQQPRAARYGITDRVILDVFLPAR